MSIIDREKGFTYFNSDIDEVMGKFLLLRYEIVLNQEGYNEIPNLSGRATDIMRRI